MMHQRRTWRIAPAASPEDLAHKLTEHTWTTDTGFELGGYLFLNDATGPDGAQEYAVVKQPAQKRGPFLQVESITFSWCTYDKALGCINRSIAGEYDNMDYVWKVEPKLAPAFTALDRYVQHLQYPFYLSAQPLPLPGLEESNVELLACISEPGCIAEVTEEAYWYFLEVLPPKWMEGSAFCFAEGCDPARLFWQKGDRYFARQLGPDEWKTFGRIAMRRHEHEQEIDR